MVSGRPPPDRLTLWGVWQRTTAQFVSDTNLAGVNNAGRAHHPFRRVFWCCLWVIGLGVTLNDVTILVNSFLAYPVSTDYTIVYDSRVTFPAVTVCNQNSVMCSQLLNKLFETPEDDQLQELVTRSGCLGPMAKKCQMLYMPFVGVSTLPTMLQNMSCFQASVENCCQMSDIGETLSMNVTWHLEELRCSDRHLRNCNSPGANESQKSDGQSRRRKRNAWNPKQQRTENLQTPQQDSTVVRKRREATPPSHQGPKMGVDTTYDEKIGFYRSFMSVPIATRLELGQTFDFLVKSCTFNGRDCLNSAYFDELAHPEYGNCFTFNSNISLTPDQDAGKRVTTMMGPNSGLSMVLFLDSGNYMPSSVTQTIGARLAIHSSDVTPLMSEAGLEIGPASVNSISISESHIVRMPSPYSSHCISEWKESGLEPYVVNPSTGVVNASGARYTLPECHRICLQLRMVRTCGCHDPLYPLTFTVRGKLLDVGRSCDFSFNTADSNCSDSVANSIGTNVSKDCTCSNPCYETVHQPQLSVASWPQGKYLGTLLKKLDFLNDKDMTYDEVVKEWGSQFTKVNVYFRDLNIAAVTESATYTYSTFISSLGGALSLYLGIALILLVEVLELLFFLALDTGRFLCGCYPTQNRSPGRHKVIPGSAPNQAVRVTVADTPGRKDVSIKRDAYY